jgi:hypothetical protein
MKRMATSKDDEQRERIETMRNDLDVQRQQCERQSQGSTFLDHARVDDIGGRYGAVNDVTIVGRDGPPNYPQLPSGPWSGQNPEPGMEPPLGHSVNDLEPSAVLASAEAPGSASADAPATVLPFGDEQRADAGPSSPTGGRDD